MRGGPVAFIDQLSEWRENNRLEFKSARSGFPRSFWETYSAFANTSGGLVIFGVDETPDGLKVAGVTNADMLVQDLWNGLNNPQKVNVNLLLDSDVSIHRIDSSEIVAIKIPRADRTQRPVYINNSMNAGTYRRNGEGDYRCSMEVIRAMVRDSFDGALDKEVAEEVGLDALNGDSIRAYRNEFNLIRPNHPWSELSDAEFLLRLGAIGRSKGEGELHPTKAGLLMFGEAWRITEEFPDYFLDCRQVSEGRRWDNRITSDSGDWSGNVYDFWKRASRMLCERLPVPFELDSDMRRVEDTPQHEAIREGLTNALVHADYYGRTGVVAIQRRSTVDFSNPGRLRIPVEVIVGGGVSDPRNKTLMTMFNLIGKGDKAGSGFDLLKRAAKYANVEQPAFEEFLEPDRTKLTLHIEMNGARLIAGGGYDASSGKENVVNNVVNVDNDVVNNAKNGVNRANDDVIDDVSSRSRPLTMAEDVLRYIRETPSASAATIAKDLGMSSRQAQRYLKQLRESGRIERIGGTRGHWEVKEETLS